MPPAMASALASYLESSLSPPHSQIILTSILSTPSPWLLLRFIHAAIHGVNDDSENRRSAAAVGEQAGRLSRPVVFVSLLRPLTLWIEIGKKMGLDFQALLRSKTIIYIDGLNYGPSSSGPGDASYPPTTRLKAVTLDAVRQALDLSSASSTRSIVSPASSPPSATPSPRIPPSANTPFSSTADASKPMILLDGIDFLLASQPSLSTLSLQSFISSLRIRSHTLVLTCHADAPLLQAATSTNNDGGSPLERNHGHFLTSMAHQSQWVFQLRGLDTGSAKDVSGVVRVSRGDAGEDEYEIMDTAGPKSGGVEDLPDAEWLYQLKGDGSVRVWGRGE